MRLNGFLFVQSLPIRPGILTHSQRALDGTLLADSRVRAWLPDGTPSYDRGTLAPPEQFVVVDDHTFRIDYVREDKILLFNVAVVVPFIINSELARKNATEAGPWTMNWLRNNEAGGRAYRIESWKPGTETVLVRFDAWKCGPLSKVRRIIALRFSVEGFS